MRSALRPVFSDRMGRRRLVLPDADEDEEQHLGTLILTPPTTARIPPANPQPLEISDDEDFVDVPDAFSPPSPAQPTAEEIRVNHQRSPPILTPELNGEIVSSPVDRFLRKLGLRLRREWLESCLLHLSESRPGFQFLDDAAKSKLCFEQFLFSDMNFSGGGLLPQNLHEMHGILLEGPFVLQVDEIVNISSPLRERYQEIHAGPKRCLKLSLTDGSQRVYGMEYRPISELKVLSPSGLKIVICNVHVRHGLLMLVPEVVEVLGGMAEELEAARERFIQEIKKPPRGRRFRNEESVPLSRRASLAAWPPMENDGFEAGNFGSDRSSFPAVSEVVVDPMPRHAPVTSVNPSTVEQFNVPSLSENTLSSSGQRSGQRTDSVPNISSNNSASVADIGMADEVGCKLIHSGQLSGQCIDSAVDLTSSSNVTVADVEMADEVNHPLILSEERETPFTYLACFLAKRAAKDDGLSFIQGKIKCILTGVKSFQFKNRSSYELRVYVDDGSLISEILIDHEVVERGIGHSPEAVTAALSSSDKAKASNMRDIMKRFQLFLMKFEGTMRLGMGKDQTTPVAVEMIQGFSTSDAWPLLTRLKTFTAVLR